MKIYICSFILNIYLKKQFKKLLCEPCSSPEIMNLVEFSQIIELLIDRSFMHEYCSFIFSFPFYYIFTSSTCFTKHKKKTLYFV